MMWMIQPVSHPAVSFVWFLTLFDHNLTFSDRLVYRMSKKQIYEFLSLNGGITYPKALNDH